MTRFGGVGPYQEHLEGVVGRLKNLGITDDTTISAGWLHDILEYTPTTFDELEQRFGSKIAVCVLALTKDKNLPKAKQEEQYVRQLSEAPLDVKIIKLCDISSDVKDLKDSGLSRSKKTKEMKKRMHHLNIIKHDLSNIRTNMPIDNMINGINEIVVSHGLRPINLT